jgi:predicted lipoprotein with Yx(FWY)xxD motif
MDMLNRRLMTPVFAMALLIGAAASGATTPAAAQSPLIQVAANPTFGSILTDSSGMSLYYLSSEAGSHLGCVGGCLGFWPPMVLPAGTTSVPAVAGVPGMFGVSRRTDVVGQVTYNGFPLYHFSKDAAAGDTHGAGIKAFGGVWQPVALTSAPLTTGFLRAVGANSTTASFLVEFSTPNPGQGIVFFGQGPGCTGLVEVGTQDMSAGTTTHMVNVVGNDLPGTVGDNGILPGATYSYEVGAITSTGVALDDHAGACYTVKVPAS